MSLLQFKNIGTLLRHARTAKGISQIELSELVGMKRGQGQMVSNIERGRCNLPPANAKKFCKHLSIEPEYMIDAMVEDYRAFLYREIKGS